MRHVLTGVDISALTANTVTKIIMVFSRTFSNAAEKFNACMDRKNTPVYRVGIAFEAATTSKSLREVSVVADHALNLLNTYLLKTNTSNAPTINRASDAK